MFLSEWREFPSAPCLAEKKLDDSSRLYVVEIARIPNTLPSLFSFLFGLRTYQHAGIFQFPNTTDVLCKEMDIILSDIIEYIFPPIE